MTARNDSHTAAQRPRRPLSVALHTTVLALLWAPGPAAQTSPSPPAEGAIWLAGPVTLYPSIVLRDVGFDSNIRNEADAAKEDFTLTAQPRLRAAVPFGSTLLTGSASVGFVYYATYKEEQSINRLFEGRSKGSAFHVCGHFSPRRSTIRASARGTRLTPACSAGKPASRAGAELKLTGITSLIASFTSHDA